MKSFKSPTELVIFDLDGTLLNSIEDLAMSTNYALRQNGYPEHAPAQYRYFVGNGITKLIERALPEEARNTETITHIRSQFIAYYRQHKTDYTRPYPGIVQLLETLRSANIKLAVASNKYHQGTVELVHHFFHDGLFDIVLGQRESIPVKPDPAIVREILAQTQSTPEHTLYVGDSGVDMQTAANSGLTSIGVTWGFRPRQELQENNACHIVDCPEEIIPIAGL